MTFMVRVAILLTCMFSVYGHADMVQPPPRNAVDRSLAPWNGSMPKMWNHHVDSYICPVASGEGIDGLSLRNGQSCFWFSHGCTIHCDKCDGKTARFGSTCGNEKTAKATICDPNLRTLNRKAICGSNEDKYYFSPWRAPGSAPVFDSCGMAGGSPWAQGAPGWAPGGAASAGIRYKNTTHAKQGDLGSKVLPPALSGTIWTAGDLVEVSWTMRTNHGGGYQWRIAPVASNLTEQVFQRTVLEPEGMSSLRWGGKSGKQLWFNATRISKGTIPAGSTWTMNPLPRVDATKYPDAMDAFPAPCYDPNAPSDANVSVQGLCSGWYGPDNLEVVDTVRVPVDLTPGEYVVQWRWDCEESSQIWSNCADVTVRAHPATTLV
mmetsp:Transcript_110706/g.220087  ORF Transcript_110706/g.220087 Transcript_110706/m.220087 type:complete len:377 (-) Transcript_110706:63-1193(-)|eukprot:CAMPEP_0172663324 /NCGR_PEP_ID=MMETSP1074-20121228/5852_1 /TAXON_ID=2916 /ORGANISM="Ceratium fusus, Strain PA161109" /LENGTH=376 /DNA_ID=CAMNT_0013479305 /DNA_START=60 /DNA_END=1190 /DNA_ORIENTATION=+